MGAMGVCLIKKNPGLSIRTLTDVWLVWFYTWWWTTRAGLSPPSFHSRSSLSFALKCTCSFFCCIIARVFYNFLLNQRRIVVLKVGGIFIVAKPQVAISINCTCICNKTNKGTWEYSENQWIIFLLVEMIWLKNNYLLQYIEGPVSSSFLDLQGLHQPLDQVDSLHQ